MINKAHALPGREESMPVTENHVVNGRSLLPPYPDYTQKAMFGMGCFWGAEKKFWELEHVYVTAVGYAAGQTPNPNYEEVCSGMTGHNEVVFLVYDPDKLTYMELLKVFWESHNPTQGMRQGNDIGSQYRSGIYTYSDEMKQQAIESSIDYGWLLQQRGFTEITTEIMDAPVFYFAETYHQQYLARNPGGYCGLGGTGVAYE